MHDRPIPLRDASPVLRDEFRSGLVAQFLDVPRSAGPRQLPPTRRTHGHGHAGHSHGTHGHGHSRPNAGGGHAGHGAHGRVSQALTFSILINVAFVGVELFFGKRTGSAALLSDALHNLGDVLALVVAWGAQRLARLPASSRRTYGFRRVTIWAGLVNGGMLMLAAGGLGWESLQRLGEGAAVDAKTVSLVAAIGVLVNGSSAWSLSRQSRDDVNVRAAFLHMAADMGVSFSVVLAGC